LEVVIVLLMGIPNHVEITTQHPRNISRRENGFEILKKIRTKIRGSRSLDVGNENREIGEGGGEVDRNRVRGGQSVQTVKEGVGPGG
jgi:hypothetical protein